MTSDMVLNNLKQFIGKELDEDDIICAFEDYEVDGETSVYVGDSDNNGYDKIAYINAEGSEQFLFTVNSENIIEDVWMEQEWTNIFALMVVASKTYKGSTLDI